MDLKAYLSKVNGSTQKHRDQPLCRPLPPLWILEAVRENWWIVDCRCGHTHRLQRRTIQVCHNIYKGILRSIISWDRSSHVRTCQVTKGQVNSKYVQLSMGRSSQVGTGPTRDKSSQEFFWTKKR